MSKYFVDYHLRMNDEKDDIRGHFDGPFEHQPRGVDQIMFYLITQIPKLKEAHELVINAGCVPVKNKDFDLSLVYDRDKIAKFLPK